MKTTALLFLLLSGWHGFSQLSISGVIYDKSTQQPVAYAGIGIRGKMVGTLSDANGAFELALNKSQLTDSIHLAAIGYKPLVFFAGAIAGKEKQLFFMEPLPVALEEVTVHSKKTKYRLLGATQYHKDQCTGFASTDGNWKGSESARLISNKRAVLMEAFSFYIIQNTYEDSLPFVLTFYSVPKQPAGTNNEMGDWVGPTFLKKAVVFKVGTRHGEFTLPLREYSITTEDDFFVSLECLVNEMDIARFCYTSSDRDEGYFKVKVFSSWRKTQSGGPDFKVRVACLN